MSIEDCYCSAFASFGLPHPTHARHNLDQVIAEAEARLPLDAKWEDIPELESGRIKLTGELSCSDEPKQGKLVGFDEVRIVSDTGGEKGQKNVQLHALPWEALAELGRVYTHGAHKYSDYNFRRGFAWSLAFDALLRHAFAFWNREDNDPESGLSHMAHAAWQALTLVFFILTGRGTDDRPEIS